MKTEFRKEENPRWYLIDAQDMVLGRLATEVVKILRGKNKASYSPSMDNGDFVVVINASKVRLTGRKLTKKMYYTHSGYLGHQKAIPAGVQLAQHPERLIEEAVKGMLPKTTLSRQVFSKLKVYGTAEHPHSAQKPELIKL